MQLKLRYQSEIMIEGTVMQIEKALIYYLFQKDPENLAFQLFII